MQMEFEFAEEWLPVVGFEGWYELRMEGISPRSLAEQFGVGRNYIYIITKKPKDQGQHP